jgi:transglutaminase-like putative cysteine protease
VIPLDTPRQTTVAARVSTDPPATQYRYVDYWGTHVVAFDIADAHDSLEIRLESVVETEIAGFEPAADASWDDLARSAERMSEFLEPTPYTSFDGGFAELSTALRGGSPRLTVDGIVAWVNGAIAYQPGVTGVHTSAAEALEEGRGVCQDLAHVSVAALRRCGIPARYVSGYLHPDPEPGVGTAGEGQSHAWVEAWTGEWWASDPTNLVHPGPRHIVVGRGRDYADVAPVRGIYAGVPDSSLAATVTITRTA